MARLPSWGPGDAEVPLCSQLLLLSAALGYLMAPSNNSTSLLGWGLGSKIILKMEQNQPRA